MSKENYNRQHFPKLHTRKSLFLGIYHVTYQCARSLFWRSAAQSEALSKWIHCTVSNSLYIHRYNWMWLVNGTNKGYWLNWTRVLQHQWYFKQVCENEGLLLRQMNTCDVCRFKKLLLLKYSVWNPRTLSNEFVSYFSMWPKLSFICWICFVARLSNETVLCNLCYWISWLSLQWVITQSLQIDGTGRWSKIHWDNFYRHSRYSIWSCVPTQKGGTTPVLLKLSMRLFYTWCPSFPSLQFLF